MEDKRDHKITSEDYELNSINPSVGTEEQSPTFKSEEKTSEKVKCNPKRKRIILLIGLLVVISISLMIFLAVFFTRKEKTKVDEYEETQYVLKVKTTITSTVGSKSSSTHGELDLTIFALDMKGDKYELMIVNGVFDDDLEKSKLESAPLDIFMSFDVSNNGKILDIKYFKEKFTEETFTLFTGIIEAFVVDQDSEFDVESECKQTLKGSSECTRNSKILQKVYLRRASTTVVPKRLTGFIKRAESHETEEGSEETIKRSIETLVDERGKIQRSSIKGRLIKTLNIGEDEEKIDFDLKAEISVISSEKLNKEQIKKLNEINEQLPHVEQGLIKMKKTTFDQFEEDKNYENKAGSSEPGSNPDPPKRLLTNDHEDRLLEERTVTYEYFTFLGIPFKLYSYLFSNYDMNGRSQLCASMKFTFSAIEQSVFNGVPCISSDGAAPSSSVLRSDNARKFNIKGYLIAYSISIFTFQLYGEVSVENYPFEEKGYDGSGNFYASLKTLSKNTITVGAEVSITVAKGGVVYTSTLTSNIDLYMKNYIGFFRSSLQVDKSFQSQFQVWVIYITIGKKCFKVFGRKICIPFLTYSDKKYLYQDTISYQYYPLNQIISFDF